MQFKSTQIVLLAGAVALTPAMMFAQMNNGNCNGMNSAKGSSMASMQDKKFVKEAAQGGLAEIKLGQLAQEKSNSEDVKSFGAKMVTDHTQLNEDMKPFVDQMSIVAPTQPSPKDEALYNRLSKLQGEQFDKQYMSAMLKDHHKDLAEFKHEVATTKDQNLKQTVQKGEQVIAGHLQMAEQVAQAHGVSQTKRNAAEPSGL